MSEPLLPHKSSSGRLQTLNQLLEAVDTIECSPSSKSPGSNRSLHTLELSRAELRGIRKALDELEHQADEVKAEGLSRFSFFAGIINLVLTAAIFVRWPADLWIFYGIECLIFIPAWWYQMTRDFNGFFYALDFCWSTSIIFTIYIWLSYFCLIPAEWQRTAFLVFYSCGLGPMTWGCVILFAGLVFHSLEKSASLFVHYTPTLVTYAILHNMEEVQKKWPGRFPQLDDLMDFDQLETYDLPSWWPNYWFYADRIYLYAFNAYMTWWILYLVFLLAGGVHLPSRGWNTVFGNIHQKANLGELLSKNLGLTNIRSHAVVYMIVHWCGSCFSMFWSTLCFRNGWILGGMVAGGSCGAVMGCAVGRGALMAVCGTLLCGVCGHWFDSQLIWIVTVFVAVVWNGAGHYDYVFAKKYVRAISLLLEEENE